MCQFNSGCPGIESESGFFPCTEETGCVTGVYSSSPGELIEQEFVDGRWQDVVEYVTERSESIGYSHACGYHD